MKRSSFRFLLALMAASGFVAACSSDGSGEVPPGAYGTAGAPGAFGGAIGTAVDSGGTVAAGGAGGAGHTSTAGSGGAASSTALAGTPAGSTTPLGGNTAITTIPSGGTSGTAGTSNPTTTAAGGSTGGGRTATGSTATSPGAGGTVAAGGSSGAGGTTASAGGATGTGATGTGTGGSNWWPAAFDANATPSPSSGKHNAGRACLSCHKTGGQGPAWIFGGTIYNQAGSSGVGHVQVGIKDGAKFLSAYSASNGNIWLPLGSNSVNWATAEIRIRTAAGEKNMGKAATNGDCNSCHDSTSRIATP